MDVEISTPVRQETVFESEVKKIELNLYDLTHLGENQIISSSASDFISISDDKDAQEIELEDREFIVASIVQSSDGTGNIQFVSTNTQFPLLEHATALDTVSISASDIEDGLDSDSEAQANEYSNLDLSSSEGITNENWDMSEPCVTEINIESVTDVLQVEEHIETEANNVICIEEAEGTFQMDSPSGNSEEIADANIAHVSSQQLLTAIIKHSLQDFPSAKTQLSPSPKRVAETPELDVEVIRSPEKEASPNNKVAIDQENYNCSENRENGCDDENSNCVTDPQPGSQGHQKIDQALPAVTLTPEDRSLPLLDWLAREKVNYPSNVILLDPHPSRETAGVVQKVFQRTKCVLCKLKLTSDTQVKEHVRVCWTFNKAKHLHCVPCNKSYANPYDLKRHCSNTHSCVFTSTASCKIKQATTDVTESEPVNSLHHELQNYSQTIFYSNSNVCSSEANTPTSASRYSTRRNKSKVNYCETQACRGCAKDFYTVEDVERHEKLCPQLRPRVIRNKEAIETVDDDIQVIGSSIKGSSVNEVASDDENYEIQETCESDRGTDDEIDDTVTDPRPRSQGQSNIAPPVEKRKLPLKEWLLLQKETKHSDGSSNVILIDPDPTVSDQELPAIDEDQPVTCLLCSRLLFSEIDVRIHVENCWWHNKKRHHRCVSCEFTFKSSRQLQHHQKYDHLCEDKEPSGKEPRITDDNDQLDDSDVEDIILADQEITLVDWLKKQQTKPGNVVLLDPDPTTATTPLTISKKHPIRCKLCSRKLVTEPGVKLHVKACWRYNKKRHCYCVLCKKTFPGQHTLTMHHCCVRSEKPKFRFYCIYCKSEFSDSRGLQSHSVSRLEFLKRRTHGKYAQNPTATNTTSKPQEISLIEWLEQQKEANPSYYIVLEPDPLSLANNFEGVSDTNPVTCKLCSTKFTGESVLKSHVEICWLHNKRIHRYCVRCEKTFPEAVNFKIHYARKHSKLPKPTYACKVCTKTFVCLNTLNTHGGTHLNPEEKPFKCQLCSKSFNIKAKLTQHMFSHSSERQFKCPRCPAAFKQKKTLSQHLATHNQDKHSANKCRFCGRFFAYRDKLIDHERTHTGERPFKCQVAGCSQSFSSTVARRIHVKRKHGRELGLTQSLCPSCGKTFGLQSELDYHIQRWHTEAKDKPFKCPHEGCAKRFGMKFQIAPHMLTHSGEKPFQCEQCGRAFASKQTFKKHQLGHENEGAGNEITCELCPKKFRDSLALKRHLKFHEKAPKTKAGSKSKFKCQLCEKRFATKTGLKKHKESHEDEEDEPEEEESGSESEESESEKSESEESQNSDKETE